MMTAMKVTALPEDGVAQWEYPFCAWYALTIITGYEFNVHASLLQHGLGTVFVSGKEWWQPRHTKGKNARQVRHKPVLPGYALVGMRNADSWRKAKEIDRVTGVVADMEGYPIRIPWPDIHSIKEMERNGLFDQTGETKPYQIGEVVRMKGNALAGAQAEIAGFSKDMRATVLAHFMGGVRKMEVPLDELEAM